MIDFISNFMVRTFNYVKIADNEQGRDSSTDETNYEKPIFLNIVFEADQFLFQCLVPKIDS